MLIFRAESLKGMITASQQLGGLPGQIAQAGEYVKVVSAPLGISKGNICRTLQASLDGVGEVSTGMSLSHLAGRSVESTSLFATELLFLCSIFHYADIPMETLKERYDPFDDEGKCYVQPSARWIIDSRSFNSPLPATNPKNIATAISYNPRKQEQMYLTSSPASRATSTTSKTRG